MSEDDGILRLTGFGVVRWQGWCWCGWRGQERSARPDADADRLRHRGDRLLHRGSRA